MRRRTLKGGGIFKGITAQEAAVGDILLYSKEYGNRFLWGIYEWSAELFPATDFDLLGYVVYKPDTNTCTCVANKGLNYALPGEGFTTTQYIKIGNTRDTELSTYSTDTCTSDKDGVGNTEIMTSYAYGQSDWKTASTITNSHSLGYMPAACCCWRYCPPGTSEGEWYLPSCGELYQLAGSKLTLAIRLLSNTYDDVWSSWISASSTTRQLGSSTRSTSTGYYSVTITKMSSSAGYYYTTAAHSAQTNTNSSAIIPFIQIK